MKLNQELELDLAHAHNALKILLDLRKLLEIINLQKGDYTTQIATVIDAMEKHLILTPDMSNLNDWRLTILGLQILKSYLQCRDLAQGQLGDIISERERLAVLCDEFQISLSNSIDSEQEISQVYSQIVRQDGRSINAMKLIEFLRLFPLPTTYLKSEKIDFSSLRESEKAKLPSTLVRLIAFINNVPLVSPQLLQPNLSYSLIFKIRGVLWHEDSERLHLRLLSTYPNSDYSVSPLILQRPTNLEGYDYEGELNGTIQFKVAQSLLSNNIFFTVGCAFELSNDSFYEIPVIGSNQLEFRVVDSKESLFFSGYNRLDLHVAQLVRELLHSNPTIRDEMTELLPVIESLTCLLGMYAQGAIFRDKVKMKEEDFQQEVLRDLRLRLGQDVKAHTAQAGGVTDISYRGVIIELKVERHNGDRPRICQKYTKQSTQYGGVESRQVSIVLVLDLTLKENPPGDIRNDIFLVDVPTHGGDDDTKKYPSKSFVFIVNGNMKKPSDYS
ncbi:MAG: hypothetical protein KME19_03540 [Microcoleus vaginatus WJT46-NPBG5]|nr:hypothetical protein [Microcoleus vaginatus WJT46-NPBG5]